MGREIELKFRVGDPEPLRRRLRELGATSSGTILEHNHIFDTPAGRLVSADCGLRIRACRALDGSGQATATLTFKGPRAAANAKSRDEFETAVSDAAATATILSQLGFQEVMVYEKRRETWHVNDCEICLDELPRLGWFAEIEGPNAAVIGKVRAELGLGDGAPVPETYVEFAAAHGRAGPGGRRQLLF